jgi:transketolase
MNIDPNRLRRIVLNMVYEKGSGHIGGSFSIAELVAYLYSNFNLTGLDGDRLVLSKGHAVPIIYAALRELGILSEECLSQFREVDSPLQGHPHELAMSCIHATTGSLGQGLSIAVGHALGMQLRGHEGYSFCICGDGEVQEGQIWEAFMMAPRHRLNNLICFIDYNKKQSDGDILDMGDLPARVESFGWTTMSVDGHDPSIIHYAVNTAQRSPLPTCIILNTTKGKGVSFMEGGWHSKVPTEEQYHEAMQELSR